MQKHHMYFEILKKYGNIVNIITTYLLLTASVQSHIIRLHFKLIVIICDTHYVIISYHI